MKKLIIPLIACIVTFALGLFAVPIQQWMLSPRDIKIEFTSEKPFVIQTKTRGRFSHRLHDIYPFRFKIKNDSSIIARNCIAMVTKYGSIDDNQKEFEEPNFEPLRIGWGAESRVDIGPGMEIFVPFLKIADVIYQQENEIGDYGLSGDRNIPQLRFSASNWPRWMSSHIPVGKHWFLVTVYFDNRKPLQQKFEVKLTDNWNENYTNILEQVTVKTIE